MLSPLMPLSFLFPPSPGGKGSFPCSRSSTPVARRHCKHRFAKSLQSSWAQECMPGTSANCSCFLFCNLVNKNQSDKSPGGPARNSPVPHHLRVSALHDSTQSGTCKNTQGSAVCRNTARQYVRLLIKKEAATYLDTLRTELRCLKVSIPQPIRKSQPSSYPLQRLRHNK